MFIYAEFYMKFKTVVQLSLVHDGCCSRPYSIIYFPSFSSGNVGAVSSFLPSVIRKLLSLSQLCRDINMTLGGVEMSIGLLVLCVSSAGLLIPTAESVVAYAVFPLLRTPQLEMPQNGLACPFGVFNSSTGSMLAISLIDGFVGIPGLKVGLNKSKLRSERKENGWSLQGLRYYPQAAIKRDFCLSATERRLGGVDVCRVIYLRATLQIGTPHKQRRSAGWYCDVSKD
ncbi:hypothetical protein Salat_2979900 [Sesamum alatum]|uniref:Uncharacterized protein n=1 Tax=Sesamum alatum TaxID=300844 RepID=A0AAE1XIA6_9LAMI|nr:hypothetical protein Salat_2979900 [Sesamum alatum]